MTFENKIEDVQGAENQNRFNGDHWTLESHMTEADAAVQVVRERLDEVGRSDDEIGQFDVAVGEAITNAITHGNLGIERESDEFLVKRTGLALTRRTRVLKTIEGHRGDHAFHGCVTIVVEDEGKKQIICPRDYPTPLLRIEY